MQNARFYVKISVALLFIALVLVPATTNAKTLSNKEMQQAIVLLQKQVAELKKEVATLKGLKSISSKPNVPTPAIVPEKPPVKLHCEEKLVSRTSGIRMVPILKDGKWVCGAPSLPWVSQP